MRRLLVALATLAVGLTSAGSGFAADGDNLRQIIIDRTGTNCASINAAGNHNSVGVGLAFDGVSLLASCYSDNTITENSPADGSLIAVHNITGVSSLGALAWDNGRQLLWACGNFSTIGTISLVTNVFVPVFNPVGGCFDGLAYDASDDTLWSGFDANNQIDHSTTAGVHIATFFPGISRSGIAVGGSLIYMANNGGQQIYRTPKDFSAVTLFASFDRRLEDLECDDLTFAAQGNAAIWVIDAYDNILNAFEIPLGSCAFGGGGGPGPPASLVLDPPTDRNPAGQEHCVTATVTDADGAPVPGVTVQFSVSGANTAGGSAVTDANGQAVFCYTGTVAGLDTITAYADTDGDAVQDPDEPSGRATKLYTAGPPTSLTLTPPSDTNTVDDQHCVTATVRDAFGNPTPGITVRFSVSGSVTTSGSAVTDANGQATFCYTGPALPGADVITAYADTDNDNVRDPDEPSSRATKAWVIPASTEGCKVTYGGRIEAANGDKGTFGGNAQAPDKGQEEYQDHGPVQPMNVHSINVQAVVCNKRRTQASIFGQATIDGSGTYNYRIDLQDLGEPGTTDTYRIRLSNGYDSGVQVLNQGNVQIHK
jgi:Bacterial Ig-like domain (group 1)